ncbi:hypothetical protein PN451_12705 [Dolichospermum planctonicum CS-1226]|uniref:Uncharacterized protein n=1 Tax=Dolichospermum planctonicum CS-1226 TaxID=3021751 RepID=A0ABT5AJP4_9CYAN|nr:hypothetical protein [Dolichospermum planctonicum]MDB9536676.1 hypothetical protein [Dolichospermum planctonicum CS-1226]
MQIKAIVISLVLGLSLPIVGDVCVPSQAVANLAFPEGKFFDVEGQLQPPSWNLTLWQAQGKYYYKNLNLKTGKQICLIGAKASGTQARPVFTWTNGRYKYRVSWQIVQRELIRLEVIDPSGKVILNQLFVSEPGKFENPNTTKC